MKKNKKAIQTFSSLSATHISPSPQGYKKKRSSLSFLSDTNLHNKLLINYLSQFHQKNLTYPYKTLPIFAKGISNSELFRITKKSVISDLQTQWRGNHKSSL